MDEQVKKQINFLTKLAGWLCLLPASLTLFFIQMGLKPFFYWVGALVIIIGFADVLLVSNQLKICYNMKGILILAFFSLFFVSPLVSIPLFIAWKKLKQAKANN